MTAANCAARTARLLVAVSAVVVPPARAAAAVTGEQLLFNDTIPNFQVQIVGPDLEQLRRTNRTYVPAIVIVGSRQWTNVGVRLKGHGSFRPLDQKPSLTLKFNEFVPGQKIDGLTKILLNNAAQDTSLLSEYVAAGMFRDAGVPAARVTHARVTLNSRDLGFYVLAEGMNKIFLEQHFKDARGNLYDVNAQDIDQRLTQSNGPPGDQSDLAALNAAARQPAAQRVLALPAILDLDRFLSYLAVSILAAHHDSYPLNRNNYRLYRNPTTQRFTMMPHGIDGSFARQGLSLQLPSTYILTRAMAETPEFNAAYRQRVGILFTNVFLPDKLTNRIATATRRLQAATTDEAERARLAVRADGFARRILERYRRVAAQLAGNDVAPLRLPAGATYRLTNWVHQTDQPAASWEETRVDNRSALSIRIGSSESAVSWRHSLVLAAGRYRVLALARYAEDNAPTSGAARGVALRLSGRSVAPRRLPAGAWQPLEFRFTVSPGAEDVEIVCESRGANSQAWFALDSLVLLAE